MVTSLSLTDARLRYDGRVCPAHGNTCLDWSGCGFTLQVRGGDVRVRLRGEASGGQSNPFCQSRVGEKATNFGVPPASCWYTLAQNLPADRVTTVQLVKISEPQFGVVWLEELQVTGEAMPALPPLARKILFIGDSITCGYGNLAAVGDPFSTETEDVTATYAWMLADRFNAARHILSASGWGVATDNCGCTDKGLMPVVVPLTRFDVDGNGEKWDPTAFIPDLIAVNLATNDAAAQSPADRLKNGITAFLTDLRRDYPSARILWIYGAMVLWMEDTVREAVKAFAVTDGNTVYLPIVPVVREEMGADNHPNAKGQHRIADDLELPIREMMGW